jgi:hypothetical protein
MEPWNMSEGRDKIVDGLKDAARFAAGEDVRARVTQFLPAPPLVDRLRQYVEIAGTDQMTVIPCEDLIEAADEIERLRDANEELIRGMTEMAARFTAAMDAAVPAQS